MNTYIGPDINSSQVLQLLQRTLTPLALGVVKNYLKTGNNGEHYEKIRKALVPDFAREDQMKSLEAAYGRWSR